MRASFKTGETHDESVSQGTDQTKWCTRIGRTDFSDHTMHACGTPHCAKLASCLELLDVSVEDLIPNYPSIITVVPDEGDDATGSASAMVVGCEESENTFSTEEITLLVAMETKERQMFWLQGKLKYVGMGNGSHIVTNG
jgi:hypothetical protein